MPSYNLPHYPFITTPPPSPPSPSSSHAIASPTPRKPTPNPSRSQLVPFSPSPSPDQDQRRAGTRQMGGRSGRRESPRDTQRGGREERGVKRRAAQAAGDGVAGGDGGGEGWEGKEKSVELPDTPPSSPVHIEGGAKLRRSHSRTPSEGLSRIRPTPQHQHQHHRRSSSAASLSIPITISRIPSPVPSRPAPPPPTPLELLTARLRRAPTRSSPLKPSPPSSFSSRERGRSSTSPRHSPSSSPSRRRTPPPPPPPRPAPPLSKRYLRLLSHPSAHLTSRSPAQLSSIPRFPLSLSSSSISPAAQHELFESIVQQILSSRLAAKLQQTRQSRTGEKAGLGGLKGAREMWIWSASVRWSRGEARRAWQPFREAEERRRSGYFSSSMSMSSASRKGHSRGFSAPVCPPPISNDSTPGTSSGDPPKRPSAQRRLSSLSFSLSALPSFRRAISDRPPPPLPASTVSSPSTTVQPFSGPPAFASEVRPSFSPLGTGRSISFPSPTPPSSAAPRPRPPPPISEGGAASYSSSARSSTSSPSSSSHVRTISGFAKEGEDDLPISIRRWLPREAPAALLRGGQSQLLPSPPPSPVPSLTGSTFSFSSSSSSSSASSASSSLSTTTPSSSTHPTSLPQLPPPIPLAPASPTGNKRSLLPSALVLFLPSAEDGGEQWAWEGGRSRRGLEDWSAGSGCS